MRTRTAVAAALLAATLTLTGCGSAVGGAATLPAGVAPAGASDSFDTGGDLESDLSPGDNGPDSDGQSDGGGGDLGLPSPGTEGGSGGDGTPGGLGDLGDLSDLNLGDLNLDDLNLENLGELGGLGGLPGLDTECLSMAGFLIAYGFMVLGPTLGTPLTAESVDEVFKSAPKVSGEAGQALGVLRAAADQAVGKSGPEVQDLFESPEAEAASDVLENYVEAQCATG